MYIAHKYISLYFLIYIMADGRSRYNRIVKLLKPLVGKTIPLHKIQRLIMIEIGTSDKVVQETSRFMVDLGMIVERDHMIFEVMKQ